MINTPAFSPTPAAAAVRATRIRLTHAAIVTKDGDVDVTLAPSEDLALGYLRRRAAALWEPEAYPLVAGVELRTCDLATLNRIYTDDEPDDANHVTIGQLDPTLALWATVGDLHHWIIDVLTGGA